ncbi:MAG: hypothetical protein II949_11260 [Prevotella sp.]|nr:hypothetical protein [Prevotella sp.]
MRTNLRQMALSALLLSAFCTEATAVNLQFTLRLKQPGNSSVAYQLRQDGNQLVANKPLPLTIACTATTEGDNQRLTVTLTAKERTYFNVGATLPTTFVTDDCDFYLPGFWYHKNLRSPSSAPSFHTSKSWNFREDRLSSPLTGVYDNTSHTAMTVLRQFDPSHAKAQVTNLKDALTTHLEGEVILGGESSIGYLGFDNEDGRAKLTFGYPYVETPRRYIRKLTLTAPITTFARLDKGERITLSWLIRESKTDDFGQFVAKTWEYCMDEMNPQPLTPLFTPNEAKAQLANYFRKSYVNDYPLKYHSGHTLRCDDCKPYPAAQLGFCGRVLLNGFNSLEHGELTGEQLLIDMGQAIFDSYLREGFTEGGYFKDEVRYHEPIPADKDVVHSIRQQSEAVYAVFHYLKYEKQHGRQHKDWELKVRTLLNRMLLLQKDDGHFPRKYRDDHSDVDPSGGSTPSATSTLVMGYKYFGDKRYLQAAKRSVDYLEENIIRKSDYFSSTLDANCEDKEAAISAVTATYYLAMVTKKSERQHYIDLCRQATYFALSWYYLWDVPFAQGQMLGELDFKSRGWGNVSVENNHIDVFVFELPHIVRWLATQTGEQRFQQICDVIDSSLCQLLPTPERLCGIGVAGFNPEVVQHTNWDYGRNGKGFYNDIFAPAWTTASLWELYSPTRTSDFLK